ncbi:MAG TPA: hypothetical protein VGO26_03310 [Amnibacterium sp.]|nr:hypothetical protein [Amnibacterium sp.]
MAGGVVLSEARVFRHAPVARSSRRARRDAETGPRRWSAVAVDTPVQGLPLRRIRAA